MEILGGTLISISLLKGATPPHSGVGISKDSQELKYFLSLKEDNKHVPSTFEDQILFLDWD